jgi:hypothetical protein
VIGVQRTDSRHSVLRTELHLGLDATDVCGGSTTKTSLSLSIASSRVRTKAGRRPQSGCSAHQTSPRFTKARVRRRALLGELSHLLAKGDFVHS